MILTALRRAAAAALLAVTLGAAAPPRAIDWTRQLVDTGVGFRMGNPKAATRLVEYGSYNCPHCAAFAAAAEGDIRRLVKSGRLSFEFRPKLIFAHDPSATAIGRCVGRAHAFAFIADYMRAAPTVAARLEAAFDADPASFERARAAGIGPLALRFARAGAMAPIAARHGLAPAALEKCLTNPALLKRIEANERAATAAGVTGTPTFFVNGRLVDIKAVQALGIASAARF
jgi:protein-disulfide isomerase